MSKLNTERAYLNSVNASLRSMKKLADGAISQLNYEELHYSPNSESNSIALLVKHMSGNMISRFTSFLTSDGEKPDRNRDEEFVGGYHSKESLLQSWNIGWEALFHTISELKDEDIVKTVHIRSEPHLVLEALQRQISHYSYHIGQIVYLGKIIKNDKWSCLSIPRGESNKFTEKMKERVAKNSI